MTACVERGAEQVTIVRRDSMNIEIVENQRPTRTPLFATVNQDALVEIGVVEGDSMQQLFQVMDAQRLPDGRIIILNGGTREFRVFNATGEFAEAFGRAGEGPGEFGFIAEFGILDGDTLVTIDIQQWQRTWLSIDGAFLGSQRIDRSPYRAETLFLAPRGKALVFLWGPYEPRPGVYRQSMALALIDSTGARADTLGWYGSLENYVVRMEEGLLPGNRPFGRDTYYAVGREWVYVGDSEDFEIQVFEASGLLRRLIRLSGLATPVSSADRNGYEAEMRKWAEENPQYSAFANRLLAEVPWPELRPAFGGFVEDQLGNLWVQQHYERGDSLRRYEVFDGAGVWRGIVHIPGELEPLDIGDDYLVARRRDALDVEYVGVYTLHRL